MGTEASRGRREEQQKQAGLRHRAGFCHLTVPSAAALLPRQEQLFQDCAEVRRAGIVASGVYTLHIANLSEPKKVNAARGGGPSAAPLCPATQCTLAPWHSRCPFGMDTSRLLLPGQCPPPHLAVGAEVPQGQQRGERWGG